MASLLSGVSGRGRPQGHPLLESLRGQTIVHTRVASRGTWTVTTRGWVLHSRIQQLQGPSIPPDEGDAIGLRDPRVVGASIHHAELLDGLLALSLEGAQGPLRLSTVPHWRLEGPRGSFVRVEETGELSDRAPGPPLHATPAALAAHAASTRSGIEERLLALGRQQWLHPGHVVSVLANAGALEEAEFERRGPLLLARLLARGEIRAGFVTAGQFTAWDLSLAEVVEHIGTTWTAIGGRTPGPDMIAWFALTEVGRAAVGSHGVRAMAPGMSGYDSPGVVGGSR
ncbi:MAG: hypothetical protein ACTHV2_02345 [Brachybacterium sp.]|uniref:hypothetical protein n=1 Tax=Brachybacterium sp. TaxID=1891286 RepID=UPI002656779E|nr:hypothetical protein [Brachybacterium sp.]MDN6328322.1 hypothetical protein [Brachybacterium sp.]MDN6401129.1 hypothetical protein [Brachybacterium sp.]